MTQLTTWWQALSNREKLLISAMLLLAIIIGLTYGILQPLKTYHKDGTRAVAAATAIAARARILVDEAVRLEPAESARPTAVPSEDVRGAIAQSSQQLGISVARLQPGSDGDVTVWLENVSAQDVYAWLKLLQSDFGVSVKEASLQARDGRSGLRAQFVLGPSL